MESSRDSNGLGMNFLVNGQPPVETILFPNQKIQPNQRTEKDHLHSRYDREKLLKFPMFRTKGSLHELEVTPPHLLLQKIFRPYLILVKLLGCNPVTIQNGVASFRYCSWSVFYNLFVVSLFIFDVSFFYPIMKHMNSSKKEDFFVYITEIILVLSQVFATQLSYLFIAFRAKQIVKFWNRSQAVSLKLIARCPNHLALAPSYRTARTQIIVWIMFSIIFGTCYVVSFQDEIRTYLDEQEYHPVTYWIMFGGFMFYSIILSVHILHSTSFTTMICVFCTSFETLGSIAMKQDGQGNMRNSQCPLLFQEVSEIYEELGNLKDLLGDIYGIHVGMEILVMLICTTINCFFIISHFGISPLFCLNFAIALPYLVWFHELCSSGADLSRAMRNCYRQLRKAMANMANKVPATEMTQLPLEAPNCISAAGYFHINMRLFTTVVGTIATYLVVMLQLQFGASINRTGGNTTFPT